VVSEAGMKPCSTVQPGLCPSSARSREPARRSQNRVLGDYVDARRLPATVPLVASRARRPYR
jgi:hypothetical protein